MALTLYFAPFTRATRPRFLLEELGVPYELKLVNLKEGEHKSEAYKKIHPLGVVPALDDDGLILVESAAIIMHLADKFADKGLAPTPGTAARGLYFEWIVFAMVTIEPRYAKWLDVTKEGNGASDDDRAKATAALEDALGLVEARLPGDYATGDAFSAADVVLGAVVIWVNSKLPLDRWPRLHAYMERIKARPAFKKALK